MCIADAMAHSMMHRIVLGEAMAIHGAWLAFKTWLAKPVRGDPDICRWYAKRQSLQGLQHARRLADFFASVLQHISYIAITGGIAFAPLFKRLSHHG